MPDSPGERPAGTLHLSARHRAMLEALLKEHLPEVEVWAYGSRVNGESHDGSDLDLVLRSPGLAKIDISRLVNFEEALRDSTVPFLVEAHDWARLPESFHREIQRNHVIITSVTGDDSGESSTSGWFYHPKFAKHWKRRPLFSLAQWVNGLAFRRIQFSHGGKPVIKIAEIKGGITQQTKFTEQTFDESVRVRNGDLLFSWSGQPDSSIDAFRWRGPDGWLNQHVFRVTPRKSIDTTFFYYLLRYLRPNFVEIARNKQTTGLGHVTKRDLASIDVAVPSPTEQREIAHILGTLDDKIELNRRMNETLDALVQTLFKSWFIDFDPVRVKMEGRYDTGRPEYGADQFPDSLVRSEIGDVPEGWKVAPVAELIEVNPTRRLRKREIAPYVDMANMPMSGHTPHMVRERPYGSGTRFVNGDTLVARITPCLENGKTAYVDFLEPNATGWGSTEFIVMSPRPPLPNLFAYCLARSPRFRAFLIRNMSGTSGRQRVSPQVLSQYRIPAPGEQIARTFGQMAGPLIARASAAARESRRLADLRDVLLPELISGRRPVGDWRLPVDRPMAERWNG